MKETVLQFGTGNFLRGFADYFIDALNKQGLYDGKIVVVSPTNSKAVEKSMLKMADTILSYGVLKTAKR